MTYGKGGTNHFRCDIDSSRVLSKSAELLLAKDVCWECLKCKGICGVRWWPDTEYIDPAACPIGHYVSQGTSCAVKRPGYYCQPLGKCGGDFGGSPTEFNLWGNDLPFYPCEKRTDCLSSSYASWNAGHGFCATYAIGLENHMMCDRHEAQGLLAAKVCPECGRCECHQCTTHSPGQTTLQTTTQAVTQTTFQTPTQTASQTTLPVSTQIATQTAMQSSSMQLTMQTTWQTTTTIDTTTYNTTWQTTTTTDTTTQMALRTATLTSTLAILQATAQMTTQTTARRIAQTTTQGSMQNIQMTTNMASQTTGSKPRNSIAEKVSMELTLKGLDYEKLKADTAATTTLKNDLKTGLLNNLPRGYTMNHIKVTLSSGSVKALLEVTPLSASNAATLKAAMSTKRAAIETAAVQTVMALPSAPVYFQAGTTYGDLAVTSTSPEITGSAEVSGSSTVTAVAVGTGHSTARWTGVRGTTNTATFPAIMTAMVSAIFLKMVASMSNLLSDSHD